MTSRIQGCVRTARSSGRVAGNLLYGFLTFSGGTWQFGYDVTREEFTVNWAPSTTSRSPKPAAAKVLLRVWNISWETLTKNSSIRASGVPPVLERKINFAELEDSDGIFIEKMSIDLDDFLIFDFEGMGSGFRDQEKIAGSGLSEQLSDMRTELEKAKKQSDIDIVSLQAVYDAEKAALRRSFDAEKARLQDEFQAREAELQREMQGKARDIEQQLNDVTEELGQLKQSSDRVEIHLDTTNGTENYKNSKSRRILRPKPYKTPKGTSRSKQALLPHSKPRMLKSIPN
ncbi:hypothetical protein ONZ43_g6890 [Nemania bipapillata]|uniref:Uncharacterized protein n=1 Tax=Nemania bipapillata TaxID=110536 RepID=A0ACC2HVM8_9PEZI|nr:hypothetical protein ONZ43_g6890 [Nemania bipapillata]